MNSGDVNFLEPSGPLQTCNGTALPLPLPYYDPSALLWLLLTVRITVREREREREKLGKTEVGDTIYYMEAENFTALNACLSGNVVWRQSRTLEDEQRKEMGSGLLWINNGGKIMTNYFPLQCSPMSERVLVCLTVSRLRPLVLLSVVLLLICVWNVSGI